MIYSLPCKIALVLFTSSAIIVHADGIAVNEPWSTAGSPHPVFNSEFFAAENSSAAVFGQGESFMNAACFVWLKFYQNCLSLFNTVKCPMEPSCSNYSIQAVKKHGAIIGVVLTADRLLHEIDEQRVTPVIMKDKHRKHLDPVENNDFWWSKSDE